MLQFKNGTGLEGGFFIAPDPSGIDTVFAMLKGAFALDRKPLVWERAFGGTDVTPKGPTAEPRNPVGAGFRAPDGQKPLAGMPLPNLEDPFAPISSWKDRPAPACFAPIAENWQPRLSYAGTYDDR